jgi:hypothetical protein
VVDEEEVLGDSLHGRIGVHRFVVLDREANVKSQIINN